jgi:phosphodiesterase/alkaline phosphatase D-like protein
MVLLLALLLAGELLLAARALPHTQPTAPQAVRDAFATLAPPLKNPVPPGCLEAIRDPKRTMLGQTQLFALGQALGKSAATWKVIVNEVPMQQFYALPYDRWEGYEAERTALLHLVDSMKNVVFLTTDTHANFIGEIRYDTLPVPVGSGVWEVVTGPVATNTYAKEVDATLGAPGTAALVAQLFLKPPPPGGIGMRCAGIDTYSYAQVTVTAKTLTVRPKDAQGQPVKEASGAMCAPLVLAAS